jgi:hypothetical protein
VTGKEDDDANRRHIGPLFGSAGGSFTGNGGGSSGSLGSLVPLDWRTRFGHHLREPDRTTIIAD